MPSITALNAARMATSVLPYPTSPQSSRSIGVGDSMSRLMSVTADFWSGVRSYSKASSNSCCQCESAAERVAGHGFARGIELEQLFGHVAHGLLDPGLGALPRRPAQPIDRRPGRAGVLLDQVEPLDRHEQLVLAGVAQLEEFLLVVADADLLQADEDADAVVDVHDEIADFEVAQVREERLGGGAPLVGRAPLFFENIGFGVDLQAGIRQAKSSRQLADRDEHRGISRIVGAFDLNGEDVVVLEQLDGALGPAGRGGDEQHGFARLAQLPDFRHEVRDPAVQLDGGLAGDMMLRPSSRPSSATTVPWDNFADTCSQSAKRASGAGGCSRRFSASS